MMNIIRLTMAQALVKWMAVQQIEQFDGTPAPVFGGVWAIFGHGNVAGLGEALYDIKDKLPTYRGHNEQSMAHAALAYAKQHKRRRMMAVTTSIGPGATNLATAAGLAHVNRLPVLFLPGDIFANRHPDPVLQQIEAFHDGLISANDCLRPLSRYFDRITRPEQLLSALPKTLSVLCDPAESGPVTLGLCQDVQAEAYEYPKHFFTPHVWPLRRVQPDANELSRVAKKLRSAKRPLLIAGGGVRYSGAEDTLAQFAAATALPVAVTQAGKSALTEDHPQYVGGVGVTGTAVANHLAEQADLVLAIGSRLQDFTTGSNALLTGEVVTINTQNHDLIKHNATAMQADAKIAIEKLLACLEGYRVKANYEAETQEKKNQWTQEVTAVCDHPRGNNLPADSQVIGAVQRAVPPETIVIGAAGSMPGELHKLWQARSVGSYHMEYGFSCMGYEIAAAIGVYMAAPARPQVIFAGDGSYLMLNAELATAVMMGIRTTLIITDNQGFGCINRLQMATGSAPFNNLFADTYHHTLPKIDFVAHAASMGARAQKAESLDMLEVLVAEAINREGVDVIVIDSDPAPSTQAGGTWWDVAIPEISTKQQVNTAAAHYSRQKQRQHKGRKAS